MGSRRSGFAPAAALAVLLAFGLVACSASETSEADGDAPGDGRFSVESRDGRLTVYVDRETGVQYVAGSVYRGYPGPMTVMVGADGRPLLADGYGGAE